MASIKYFYADVLRFCVSPNPMYYKVCEYDQEMSKSQMAYQPMAPRGQHTNILNAIKDGGSGGVVCSFFLLLLQLFVCNNVYFDNMASQIYPS